MMGWYGGGMGWGGWVFMTVLMIGFWALVVVGVLVAVRALRGESTSRRGDDAARLLDERFARGEIDAEEYRARRDLLTSGR